MIPHQRSTVFLSLWFGALALAVTSCGGGSGSDKVTCSVNTDCDPDEVCTNGMCTGRPDPCTTNADCASDEACTNGNCV